MWYLAILFRAEIEETVRTATQSIWPDDPNGSEQFSILLADGSGNPWRGGNIAVTAIEFGTLRDHFGAEDVRWYRYSLEGSLVEASHDGPSPGTSWGWAESLAANGVTAASSV